MAIRSRWRWVLVGVVLTAAIIIGILSFYPAPASPLADIKDIEELRIRFNHDRGSPRLILLLSPT